MNANQTNPYQHGLERCEANHAPLTPLGFLRRAAEVYPDHIAVIDGATAKTWSEIERRCRRLASALARRGIGKNDTVSVLAPNSLAAYECHFGVPMAGAVLNAINVRLDADTIAFILDHGESKALLVDAEFAPLAREALARSDAAPLVIDIVGDDDDGSDNNNSGDDNDNGSDDNNGDNNANDNNAHIGALRYEDFLASGDGAHEWAWPADEWDAISLNYTSGTTGDPKGVVYHHRGAYLNALSNIVGWQMPHHPVYLWTLPMFHCNGWCFPWTLAALAGVNVCLRRVDAASILDAIAAHGVTHFCGAPIIMNMIINATPEERREFSHSVEVMTAAAPPPAAVLAAMEENGFHMTHVYGLT
ncbi:MAG: AMP-binding protein, partial [bacterium]